MRKKDNARERLFVKGLSVCKREALFIDRQPRLFSFSLSFFLSMPRPKLTGKKRECRNLKLDPSLMAAAVANDRPEGNSSWDLVSGFFAVNVSSFLRNLFLSKSCAHTRTHMHGLTHTRAHLLFSGIFCFLRRGERKSEWVSACVALRERETERKPKLTLSSLIYMKQRALSDGKCFLSKGFITRPD